MWWEKGGGKKGTTLEMILQAEAEKKAMWAGKLCALLCESSMVVCQEERTWGKLTCNDLPFSYHRRQGESRCSFRTKQTLFQTSRCLDQKKEGLE